MPTGVASAEPEAPDHLKKSQMSAVTDLVDIVGADTVLDIAVARGVWLLKLGFKGCIPALMKSVVGSFSGMTLVEKSSGRPFSLNRR